MAFRLALVSLALVGVSLCSDAAAATRRSAWFAHRFEGDASPGEYTDGGSGTHVVSGGIVTYSTTSTTNRYWSMSTGSKWALEISSSVGFSVEVRLRVTSATTGPYGSFALFAGDGSAGAAIVFVGPNFVKARNGSWTSFSTLSTADNGDAFHVFRLTRSSSTYVLWRDGVSIGTVPANADYILKNLDWGDTSSSV
jgi:hypothetical protein